MLNTTNCLTYVELPDVGKNFCSHIIFSDNFLKILKIQIYVILIDLSGPITVSNSFCFSTFPTFQYMLYNATTDLTSPGVVVLLSRDYLVGLIKGNSYPSAFWDISQNVPNKFPITDLNSASFYENCK